MKVRVVVLILFICLWVPVLVQGQTQSEDKVPFAIGETVKLYSEVLGEQRELNIYLPNGYAESGKTYPVIYLLDGSRDEDFIHISGLVQFLSFSWINAMPESIVVGIGTVDRRRDFTYPTQNKELKDDFPTSGGSAAFIQFLGQELQPYITQHYKVNETTTLLGQSLGGLLVSEVLLKNTELFDNYLIVSPSLWWDDESLLELTAVSIPADKSVYIAVGKEGEIMERVAKQLYYDLRAKNPEHKKMKFDFFEGLDHGDALHNAAYQGFEFTFKKKQ